MTKRLLLAVALLNLCLLSAPLSVAAFDPFGGVDCSQTDVSGSTACQDNTRQDPITGTGGLLLNITNIVAFVGGAAAVIVIIIGAIRYITSGSDLSTGSRTDTDVESAKRTISNAMIGLAVIILAHTLIIFVIKKL